MVVKNGPILDRKNAVIKNSYKHAVETFSPDLRLFWLVCSSDTLTRAIEYMTCLYRADNLYAGQVKIASII